MFEDEVIADVKALAEGYGTGHKVKLKTTSTRMYGNGLFLKDYFKGKRSASTKRLQKLYGDFVADWPEGVPFPDLKHLR